MLAATIEMLVGHVGVEMAGLCASGEHPPAAKLDVGLDQTGYLAIYTKKDWQLKASNAAGTVRES